MASALSLPATNDLPAALPLPDVAAAPSASAEITDEIRFAVVMYGGSSLAIYINGVVQELFHLVRATAAKTNKPQELYIANARGTETIYRELGQRLGSDNPAQTPSAFSPVRTRFVVDILSGTSAGGINAVFLAKALANDQDFGVLKNLWLQGGAFERLLNDNKTLHLVGDKTLSEVTEPQSLINSQQMYRLIYNALREMETSKTSRPSNSTFSSPYMEELDLFVTRTDIHGQPVPIRLSNNTVVSDFQYKDVLHFQYAEWIKNLPAQQAALVSSEEKQGNDFLGNNDAFLAYAARCTSAFPVAFEPMKLNDICPLAGYGTNTERFDKDVSRWLRFFAQTPHEEGTNHKDRVKKRPFTDGGVLDNKPFSFAIDTLDKRWSDKSVQRKLIYIEPAPQPLSETQDPLATPDALGMGMTALLTLPSYEAIHSDLMQLLHRNNVIQRLNMILDGLNDDMDNLFDATQAYHDADNWENGWRDKDTGKEKDFDTIVQERGVAYGAYHRLKVRAVTDSLTQMAACQMGLREGSEIVTALGRLIACWRAAHYACSIPRDHLCTFPVTEKTALEAEERGDLESKFLTRFDLGYRQRRLLFVRNKINDALLLKTSAQAESSAALKEETAALEKTSSVQGETSSAQAGATAVPEQTTSESQRAAYLNVKGTLRTLFLEMRGEIYKLNTVRSRDDSPLRRWLQQSVEDGHIGAVTENVPDDVLRELEKLIAGIQEEIEAITWRKPVAAGEPKTESQTAKIKSALKELDAADQERFLRYVTQYEYFDSVLFPALYGTGINETTLVDIVRVSPMDAVSLINETNPTEKRRKLAGTALGNFGALLELAWRRNDIMWGRLDGAECLIRTIAASSGVPEARVEEMVRDAQEAIVTEELMPQDKAAIIQWLVEAVPEIEQAEDEEHPRNEREKTTLSQKLSDWVKKHKGEIGGTGLPEMRPVFELCLKADEYLAFLKDSYEVDRNPSPKAALQVGSRSAAIVGKMLNVAAKNREVNAPALALLPRIGQAFAGLVEIALPHSINYTLVRYWLQLLYLFEIFLIVPGTLLGKAGWAGFGWNMLFLTALAHLSITYLHATMRSKSTGKRVLKGMMIGAGVLLAGLAILGFLAVRQAIGDRGATIRSLILGSPVPSPAPQSVVNRP